MLYIFVLLIYLKSIYIIRNLIQRNHMIFQKLKISFKKIFGNLLKLKQLISVMLNKREWILLIKSSINLKNKGSSFNRTSFYIKAFP